MTDQPDREPDPAEQLRTELATVQRAYSALASAHQQALADAESAEARRRVAWGRAYSTRRAACWLIGTVRQQYRYDAWRPGDVIEFLLDLAAIWVPEADDPEYRRRSGPRLPDWSTTIEGLGLHLLLRTDQWEATELALVLLDTLGYSGYARPSSRPVHGVDELRAALAHARDGLHHAELADRASFDGYEG